MSQATSSRQDRVLIACWVLILLFIPALSINGRTLQRWVIETLGHTLMAWLIFFALAAALSTTLWLIGKRGMRVPVVHLLWVIPFYLGAPFYFPLVEERVHFLVFGAFGALSMLVFRPVPAFLLCLTVAAGDEILQYFLPDRVGDMRDVAMNAVASVAAALFIWLAYVRPRRAIPDR